MAKKASSNEKKLTVSVRTAVIVLCMLLAGMGGGALGWAAGHGIAAAILEGVGVAVGAVYFLDRFIA